MLVFMRPAIGLFDLLVAFIQALVLMVLLEMSYIAGAVSMEEH